MNIELFLGRFHPLIVHLPIGFLLFAAVLEGLSRFYKDKFKNLDQAISIALLLGGLAAIGSAIIGYLLAGGGGYDEQTLFWHKWLGISLAVLSLLAWAIKSELIKFHRVSPAAIIVFLLILVSVTGHLGGNLTHGSDYLLVYAPDPVKKLFGKETVEKAALPSTPDSVLVFQHLIKPTLELKCYACHNETKAKGGLVLTNQDDILKGGENGEVVLASHATESPLFQRVTLPQSSQKFMPPKGAGLNYSELKVVEWWINSGASFDKKLSEYDELPEGLTALLMRDYHLDASPRPIYDLLSAPKLSEANIQDIANAGFNIKTLANNHPLYDVSSSQNGVDESAINSLLEAKEQITWLNLSNKGVTDEMMQTIGQLPNLTRLMLPNNPISDDGLSYIKELPHLQILNLYGTSITDESLKVIGEMPTLKHVYLWQTKVTNDGLEALAKNRPDLKVQLGADSE